MTETIGWNSIDESLLRALSEGNGEELIQAIQTLKKNGLISKETADKCRKIYKDFKEKKNGNK